MTTEVEKIYDPLVGRTVGSGECGALTSDYMLRMTGGKYQWAGEPGGGQLPPGTVADTAWNVYTTTNWGAIGFEKIDNPSFSQVMEGDIFFLSPATTGKPTGHTGIVANTYNNNITTFEQNYADIKVVQKMPGQNSWSVYSGFDGIVRKKSSTPTPSPGDKSTNLSANGETFIKNLEGLELACYHQGDGTCTIGWGHARPVSQCPGVGSWKITKDQAETYFWNDVHPCEAKINSYFTRSFNANQFDALVSFLFNLGTATFTNDAWDKNADNKYITDSMSNYVHDSNGAVVNGLVTRRNAEIALFNTPVSGGDPTPNEGEIEMIMYKVTDKNSKMNGAIWMFNGEQLTRLDGVSAAKFGKNFKTVDVNQAEMSSFKNIGFRTVGEFKY